MNLWILKPRHRIRMVDGTEAVVLDHTQDGAWIRVKYLSADDGSSVGMEDIVSEGEVEALLGIAQLPEWGKRVGVNLLMVRGEEGYPDTYRATAMSGVPFGVTITAEDAETKVDALERLVTSLKLFGFQGHVLVHDVTEIGRSERYGVEV